MKIQRGLHSLSTVGYRRFPETETSLRCFVRHIDVSPRLPPASFSLSTTINCFFVDLVRNALPVDIRPYEACRVTLHMPTYECLDGEWEREIRLTYSFSMRHGYRISQLPPSHLEYIYLNILGFQTYLQHPNIKFE